MVTTPCLSTAGLEFVEHLNGELGSGAPERVSEGDGAAVHVDLVLVESEFIAHGHALAGKKLR